MKIILATAACLAVILGMAAAGSDGGVTFRGVPVFALCAALALIIQWLVFLPSWWLASEKVFDLAGSLTYLLVTVTALVWSAPNSLRDLVLGGMVIIWALRLGGFLFLRARREGDARFDRIKTRFGRFLLAFTLQGVWIVLTAGAALAAITASREDVATVDVTLIAGALLWLAGMTLEVVADEQKRRFRRDPAHHGQFIRTGLWAWARHPNYSGEILLWLGVAVTAAPALTGWQLLTLVSPLFVWVLLTRISGIPLLERRAEARWGDDPRYREWRKRTPALLLRPPKTEKWREAG